MNSTTKEVIEKYLNFGGDRVFFEFTAFNKEIREAKRKVQYGTQEYRILEYIHNKIAPGIEQSKADTVLTVTILQYSLQDIEDAIEKEDGRLGKIPATKRKKPAAKKKAKTGIGKITDEGKAAYSSRVDQYWEEKEIKIVFRPDNRQLRTGAEIPKSYEYTEADFLKQHYQLRAIEFGNWVTSQRDRANYVAGLGIALFDLCQYIGFSPKQLALEKRLSVAFGARGRGSAVAHFEPSTFAINITRYRRPEKGTASDRTKLLIASGGMGSFAHEYGHALDYFGGTFIEHSRSGALSDGRSQRVKPNKALLKLNNAQGIMERLLHKIIWASDNKYSAYYQRLKKNKEATKYFFYRNELFARAFESYVHFKMQKKKYRNLFLAETKYDNGFYLTMAEMAKLEKDFDSLLQAIKKGL